MHFASKIYKNQVSGIKKTLFSKNTKSKPWSKPSLGWYLGVNL